MSEQKGRKTIHEFIDKIATKYEAKNEVGKFHFMISALAQTSILTRGYYLDFGPSPRVCAEALLVMNEITLLTAEHCLSLLDAAPDEIDAPVTGRRYFTAIANRFVEVFSGVENLSFMFRWSVKQ